MPLRSEEFAAMLEQVFYEEYVPLRIRDGNDPVTGHAVEMWATDNYRDRPPGVVVSRILKPILRRAKDRGVIHYDVDESRHGRRRSRGGIDRIQNIYVVTPPSTTNVNGTQMPQLTAMEFFGIVRGKSRSWRQQLKEALEESLRR